MWFWRRFWGCFVIIGFTVDIVCGVSAGGSTINAGGFRDGVAVIGFGDCTINRHRFANKRWNIADIRGQNQRIVCSGQFIECLHILFGYKEWGRIFTILLGQPAMREFFFLRFNWINTTMGIRFEWHLRIGNDGQSFRTCLGDRQHGRCFTISMVNLLHALGLCEKRTFLIVCVQIISQLLERTWRKNTRLFFSLGHVNVGLSNTFGF